MTPKGTFFSAKVAEANKGDLSWMSHAACRNYDSATFFPAGSGATPPDYDTPLAICRACPALAQCRAWATTAGDIGRDGHTNYGQVVGGCAPKVRNPVGRPARQPNGKPDSQCGTRGGYMRHWRYGEPYCDPCREANSIYAKAKEAKKRAS